SHRVPLLPSFPSLPSTTSVPRWSHGRLDPPGPRDSAPTSHDSGCRRGGPRRRRGLVCNVDVLGLPDGTDGSIDDRIVRPRAFLCPPGGHDGRDAVALGDADDPSLPGTDPA